MREIEKEHEIQHDGCRKDRVPAEEIDLDLHRIVEPTKNINVVPTFFVVTTRWVIVNADLVENVAVKIRVEIGLQNVFENPQF